MLEKSFWQIKITGTSINKPQIIFRIKVSMQNHLKGELHHVLSEKNKVMFGTIIQAIACYLNDGEKTSPDVEVQKHFKETRNKETRFYISQNNLCNYQSI